MVDMQQVMHWRILMQPQSHQFYNGNANCIYQGKLNLHAMDFITEIQYVEEKKGHYKQLFK